ncbi:MAG: hypothetical protein C4K49_03955 [Candidatus Thorarchaeota archaeon]|nr:MAG: hypothetical protein C4K49_03955 [Candidatus Thorarchaeota archaeon]
MIESAGSRLRLAAATLAAGALGELLSPDLFLYGVGVDGVIVLQISFFGLILLGLYIASGEILRKRRLAQSPSVPVPENVSTETPGASAEELQTRLDQKVLDRIWFFTILVGGLLYILLFSAEPDSTIFLLEVSSLVTGFYCAVSTPILRMGIISHNHAIVNFCSFVLVVTNVLWVAAQRFAYLTLVGDLAASGYVALAQLSSEALLAYASLGLLELGLVIYFSRPKGLRTVEPAQKQA